MPLSAPTRRSADLPFTSLNLSGGSLSGSANFDITASGAFTWTNGIMGGSGVTTVAAGASFTIGGSQPRLERVLNNGANAVLTSFSSFFINGGTFNNQKIGRA